MLEIAQSLLRLHEYAELRQQCIDAHIAAGRVVRIGTHYYLTNQAETCAIIIQRAFQKHRSQPNHTLRRGSLVKMIATGRVYAVIDVKFGEFGVRCKHGVRYMDFDMDKIGTEWKPWTPFRFKKGQRIVNISKPSTVFTVDGHTVGSWHRLRAPHMCLHAKINKRQWRLATADEYRVDQKRARTYTEAFEKDVKVDQALKMLRRI